MGKRLGGWFQLTSLKPKYTATQFFNNFFLKTPYFAATELIVQVIRLDDFGQWIKDLGNLANSYPSIEIVLYLFWDMANESQWLQLNDYLEEIQNIPSIKYVGCDGEHMTEGGDFPTGKLGSKWNAGEITCQELIDYFDRAKSDIETTGKSFICYYLTYGCDEFKARYPQIGHIRFPCQGGRENWCDNQAESPFIGQSYGTYENHNFPCTAGIPAGNPPADPTDPVPSGQDNCALCKESYSRIIEHAVDKSDTVRHFVDFAVGFDYDSWTGVSGKTTNHIWDNPTWRTWIWEIVQTYPEDTFILATSGGETIKYVSDSMGLTDKPLVNKPVGVSDSFGMYESALLDEGPPPPQDKQLGDSLGFSDFPLVDKTELVTDFMSLTESIYVYKYSLPPSGGTASDFAKIMNLAGRVGNEALETIIDLAIDLLNLFGANISNLSGDVGYKTAGLTNEQKAAVFNVSRQILKKFYVGGLTASVAGMTVSMGDLLTDKKMLRWLEKLGEKLGADAEGVSFKVMEDMTDYG